MTRLPMIARRDAELQERARRIRDLEREVSIAREKLIQRAAPPAPGTPSGPQSDRASFRTHLLELRRLAKDQDRLDPKLDHPFRQLPHKLWIQWFGGSHGILVPQVHAVWTELDQVDLAGLPDRFVLKSDRGAGGRGVLQVSKGAGGGYTARGQPGLSAQEIVAMLRPAVEQGRIFGPFFAEEMLHTQAGDPVQDDIKIYSFHGEVMHVLLRRVSDPGDRESVAYRYLRPDGSDLGSVVAGLNINASIAPPVALSEAIEAAKHLSRAVGLPFCRVDVYATDRGVVLGEITRAPGGPQRYRARHDENLGSAWEEARWRLDLDLAHGRPFGMVFGEHPATNRYPAGHEPHGSIDPWRDNPVQPCFRWCG